MSYDSTMIYKRNLWERHVTQMGEKGNVRRLLVEVVNGIYNLEDL